MPLGTVAPTPREGQGAPLRDHVEPQCQAAPAAGTALHDYHQGLEGSLCQEERDRGEHIPLLPEALVVEPSGKRCPRLSGLGPSGIVVAPLGRGVLLLPTIPLLSAASVVKCLATVPVGWPGYHGVKASRMAR